MTDLEVPNKRYETTITLTPPTYLILVNSWEEAEEKAQELLEKCMTERDRGTTSVHIAPLKRTKWLFL